MGKHLSNITILDTPTDPKHAATVEYVESRLGEHLKPAVLAAATENVTGTYSTLAITASGNGALTVDGIAVAAGDRVLLPNQADTTQNGIYTVTNPGSVSAPYVLTRAADFDSNAEIKTGVKIHVAKGTSYHDVTFVLTTDEPNLDVSPLVFEASKSGTAVEVREKRFSVTGNGSTAAFPFTHAWGTFNVTAELIEDSATNNYPTVYADVTRPTNNTIAVTFGSAPAIGENYILIVRAEV
jgi:hypothetical protein